MAYADPPYLGQARLYRKENPNACEVNHRVLIGTLVDTYPDGWALSCTSSSLRVLLPMCPPDVRVMAWVKPWAFFKPSLRVNYCWEPVIVRAKTNKGSGPAFARDWLMANPIGTSKDQRRGHGFTPGAKPPDFCLWLFAVLGLRPDDEFHDLFPGSGAVTRAWENWRNASRGEQVSLRLNDHEQRARAAREG